MGKVGDLCVAKWDEDGVWYNAKILNIIATRATVLFVDYGNQDTTRLAELKPVGSQIGRIDEAGQFSDPEEGNKEKKGDEDVVVEGEKEWTKWKVGDLCVAMWNEDLVWYNSEILEIVGERVKVRFVEYGNEDYATLGQLKMAGSLDAEVEKEEVKKA